jgi:hypothetical protein
MLYNFVELVGLLVAIFIIYKTLQCIQINLLRGRQTDESNRRGRSMIKQVKNLK